MSQQPDNLYETYLRSLRLDLLSLLTYNYHEASVLDVGCADGNMWADSQKPKSLDGVDIDDDLLKKAGELGVYRTTSSSIDNFDMSGYDIVVCFGVLEHVEDYWTFSEPLQRSKRIVMTVPNAWSFHRITGYYMGMIEDPASMHAGDLEIGHKRVFTPEMWRDFITVFAADGGFHKMQCGSIGMKVLSSQQMIDIGDDKWQSLDKTGEDLILCGDNCFYGAELYAILEKD